MKCSATIKQACPLGVGTGKLDRRLNAFASRAAKVSFGQPMAGEPREFSSQFARQFSYVALQHGRTTTVQLVVQCGNHRRMVVTKVVQTVAGQKSQNTSSVFRTQLCSHASGVAHVHLEQIE